MDESIRFYTEVLGMEIAEKRERTRAPSSHVTRIVMVDKNGNYLKYADKHTHCSAR